MKLRTIVVISALLSGAVLHAGPESELERAVLWIWHEPDVALFLPETLLNEKTLEELPLGEGGRRRIESQIQAARAALQRKSACADAGEDPCQKSFKERVDAETQRVLEERGATTSEEEMGIRRLVERAIRRAEERDARYGAECRFQTLDEGDRVAPTEKNLTTALAHWPLSFAGSVVHEEAGWNAVRSRPVTMVYIRVEEIFKDDQRTVWPGKIVGFDQLRGDVLVDGVRLCTVPETRDKHLTEGHRVLVFGYQFGGEERYLHLGHAFPLSPEGEILPRSESPATQGPTLDDFRKITRAQLGGES